ncbi:MAG: ABC transporter permease [Acutalibacteraceae bacterium]
MATVLSCVEVFLTDGFMYSLLALGFYISFSILDFPDLSVEGTVLLGGVAYSLLVCAGINPWLAIIVSFILGALAGSVTGILHVKLHIRPLLCGILVSTGLISINLVMTVVGNGGNFKGEDALSTISFTRSDPTVLRTFPAKLIPDNVGGVNVRALVTFLVIAVIFKLILDGYLKTKNGLLLRATGNNTQFVSMLAQDPGKSKIIGLAISNGYAAVAGALIATSRANANQGMGIGMVVIGLASVIIGLSLFGKLRFMKPTTMVILGSVIYQACLAIATYLGVPSAYNKLIMAILFTIALVMSNFMKKGESRV